MKKLKRKLGFTIAELVIATMLVAGIAMIMLPSLKSDNERQVFGTSLKKTMTELQQITQAVGMLEARGKISLAEGNIVTLQKTFPLIMKETTTTKKIYTSYLKNYKPQLVKDITFLTAKGDLNTVVLTVTHSPSNSVVLRSCVIVKYFLNVPS